MGSLFASFAAMLMSFFGAAEKTGKALNNLATIAEEASGGQVEESRANREITRMENLARRKDRMAALGITDAELKQITQQ